eukprot:Sspe_Gene.28822::Locus_13260_Transcript_1_1_Confidence_1.000_Length_2472::g.28822::m.28822
MVCCTFVCNMWKAGGLFKDLDNEVNCAELSNLDIYDLPIFDSSVMWDKRPEVCRDADPKNQLCQLVGPYTINLNHVNDAKMYKHFGEHCRTWVHGVGPDYWPAGKVNGTC